MTKKAVKTRSGDLLIGVILEKDDPQLKAMISMNLNKNDGIHLKRESHITFLADEEIENIRDAHPWEREKIEEM